jgi:predicted NBD/HSP70 family sugar kinase
VLSKIEGVFAMSDLLFSEPKFRPILDPEFEPIALRTRAYRSAAQQTRDATEFGLSLERKDQSTSVYRARLLPHRGDYIEGNERFVERVVKFLFWQKGGWKISLAGPPELAAYLKQVYSPTGARAFDNKLIGKRIYGHPLCVEHVEITDLPAERETSQAVGGHLNGCRIGFDLGGSDRKCAAVIDGKVVHSEEVIWDPYFQSDPEWHYREINDSLERAAAKLPRVDCIGGSSAGVYVNNEVRVASLFRGVSNADFKTRIRNIFTDLQAQWGNIPLVVVNDGEVTALAGSMSLEDSPVLGVAMGTSLATGYVTTSGRITNWLNELAFVPVDYRQDAPKDEWSGDRGVGAQYFSQQAVARLAPVAGIQFPKDMPFPERLVSVQELMESGDTRARQIYETIGVYFGYNIAQYAEFYELKNILLLGRVMTGTGGQIIVEKAQNVVEAEFPDLNERIRLVTPGEKEKRLGQAVAAASLPCLQEQ